VPQDRRNIPKASCVNGERPRLILARSPSPVADGSIWIRTPKIGVAVPQCITDRRGQSRRLIGHSLRTGYQQTFSCWARDAETGLANAVAISHAARANTRQIRVRYRLATRSLGMISPVSGGWSTLQEGLRRYPLRRSIMAAHYILASRSINRRVIRERVRGMQ